MTLKSFALATTAAAIIATPALARDDVQVMGSSTVLPYAQIVVENFQREYPNYKVTLQGGGSSAGLKAFCEGLGEQTIDVANASRGIKDSEVTACGGNGVESITEVRIGYDGIVFASDVNGPAFALEPKDVYLALAAEPVVDGKVVKNPYAKLSDVNSAFPAWDIKFFIPGEKHGTREVLETKVLEEGCKAVGAFDAYMNDLGLDKKAAEKKCYEVRKDGASVDIDGDYTETLQRLDADKESIGVFGLAFYEANTDKLRVATMSGVKPTAAAVASGTYPVSRPLFFYVKNAHLPVIPGMAEYVTFFVSDDMIGPGGPLEAYGLVPAPESERDEVRAAVEAAVMAARTN